MALTTEQELKRNIDSNKILPVYIIYGNDDGLKKLYSSKIAASVANENDCFNFQRFSGDCDLQYVYDFVMQFPLVAERKCAVVCDYDFEKCGENGFSKLLSLITDMPESAVLVIWFDTVEIDEKKSSRFKKIIAATEKLGGAVVKLDHRNAGDLTRMLCAAANKRGAKMETSTARYLIETSSADYNTLKNEIEKLCAYVGDGLITKETVDAVCVKSIEASVYNISRELVSRNLGKSINMLDELMFLKVKPHLILSVLSSAFIEMYIAKTAGVSGVKLPEAAQHFGYKNREFVITRAADSARRLSETQIGLCLSELLKTDVLIKSSPSDEKILLEELMVKLVYIMSEGECIDKT